MHYQNFATFENNGKNAQKMHALCGFAHMEPSPQRGQTATARRCAGRLGGGVGLAYNRTMNLTRAFFQSARSSWDELLITCARIGFNP